MEQLKALRPLVQLIPAVAVAAAVAVTLPHTQPVLADIPERLSAVVEAPADSAEPEPAEEPEDTLPTLPYADGVYTGSSRGYGGQVKVQVTMEGGRITALEILDASHETAAFLKRASKRLTSTVLETQTWEVDAVSEATYTSRGILGAIRNALTGEVVNNPLPPQPKPAEPVVVEAFTTPSTYRDGVYTASADGFGGPITVQVTVESDAITDITILNHAGETASYFSRARRVVSEILTTGTPEGVDAVSGATYSSTGILNAVKQALSKAANETESATESPAEEQPAQETETTPDKPLYPDGVYTVPGQTAEGAVTVTVTDGQVASVDVQATAREQGITAAARIRAALKALFSGQRPQASAGASYSTRYTADSVPEALAQAVQDALQQAMAAAPAQTPDEPAASSAPEAAQEPEASSAASAEQPEPALEPEQPEEGANR